jgi:hypothetical protein
MRRTALPPLILLALVATVALPRHAFAQGNVALVIDRSQFLVSTLGVDGTRTALETNRVPLDPSACYEWRLHFSNNPAGELAWREEFELPAPGTWPASDHWEVRGNGRVAVANRRGTPQDGWISQEWCVGEGDPTGKYVITVYVHDRLAKTFEFFAAPVPPEADSVIVEVLGREIRMSQRFDAARIVFQAVLDRFVTERGIAPTPGEVDALQRSGFAGTKEDATEYLQTWKVKQALFRQYGGRVLLFATGPEPVDAYRDLLKDDQQRSTFRILDRRLEPSFWRSFATDSTQNFLTHEEAKRLFDRPWWEGAVPVEGASGPAGDPLSELVGDWRLTVFVMGGGQFGGPTCGTRDASGPPSVTLTTSPDSAIAFSVSCDDGSNYAFRLQHVATGAYSLTVKSAVGISVEDLSVTYRDGQGWRGARDQQVAGKTQSVTAMVAPIEGRLWHGWMVAVLPTSGIGREDDVKEPYFRADLTRRK